MKCQTCRTFLIFLLFNLDIKLNVFLTYNKIYYYCLGVCVSSAGLTCHPRKKPKIVSHDVVLYNANGSQVKLTQSQIGQENYNKWNAEKLLHLHTIFWCRVPGSRSRNTELNNSILVWILTTRIKTGICIWSRNSLLF